MSNSNKRIVQAHLEQYGAWLQSSAYLKPEQRDEYLRLLAENRHDFYELTKQLGPALPDLSWAHSRREERTHLTLYQPVYMDAHNVPGLGRRHVYAQAVRIGEDADRATLELHIMLAKAPPLLRSRVHRFELEEAGPPLLCELPVDRPLGEHLVAAEDFSRMLAEMDAARIRNPW